MSRIVISDVHGTYKTLMALVAKLPPEVPITFAGDLVDRGLDSRKVVEFVKNGGYDCVVGNHEQMMIDELQFRTKPDGTQHAFTDHYHGIWEMNGGDRCLESYRIDATEEMASGEIVKTRPYDIAALKEHLAWMKTLPVYIEYKDCRNAKGDYLLVSHSTAAYAWDEYPHDSPQFRDNLLWERTPYPAKIEGIYSVYGHTPQRGGATVKEHFACIDGGAYFKREPYGRLIALQYPEMIVVEQENVE